MSKFLEEAGLIILGWGLGLLSTVVYDSIKKASLKNEVKKGILTELQEAKTKLAFNALNVAITYGVSDRAMLEWMRKHASDVRQLYTNENTIKTLDLMLQFSDKDIKQNVQATSMVKLVGGRTIGFKKTNLPFLLSKFGNISLFDTIIQRLLLEINTQVGFMNEEIDNGRNFLRMSFSLEGNNYRNNELNLQDSNKQVGQIAKKVVDLIEAVIPKLDN